MGDGQSPAADSTRAACSAQASHRGGATICTPSGSDPGANTGTVTTRQANAGERLRQYPEAGVLHHAAVARKIHLSQLFRFPEPPLTPRRGSEAPAAKDTLRVKIGHPFPNAVPFALHTLVDRLLQRRDRLRALLITTNEVAHIIARVAEAAVLQSRFDPGRHRSGKGNVHRCHG
jgi:hypothetical protein